MSWSMPLRSTVQMDESMLQGIESGLGTVAYAHLAQNRGNMETDGLLRDAQTLRDLAIGPTLCNGDQHFGLPRCEFKCGDPLGHAVKGFPRHVAESVVCVLDCGHQLVPAAVLRQVRHSAATNGALDVLPAL